MQELERFAEASPEPLHAALDDILNAAAALDAALLQLKEPAVHNALCEAWGEDLDRNETRRLVDAIMDTLYQKLTDMIVPRKEGEEK